MQEDEFSATTLRDRHRTVLREGIEAHQGEIVQFYGDGTLSVFPSAVQAVDAAVDIQRHFRLDPAIPVRIHEDAKPGDLTTHWGTRRVSHGGGWLMGTGVPVPPKYVQPEPVRLQISIPSHATDSMSPPSLRIVRRPR